MTDPIPSDLTPRPWGGWAADALVDAQCFLRAIDYDWVISRLISIAKTYQVIGLAYDRWRIDDFLNAAQRIAAAKGSCPQHVAEVTNSPICQLVIRLI